LSTKARSFSKMTTIHWAEMIMNLLSHTLEWPQQMFNSFCCYLELFSYGKRLKYPWFYLAAL
jgi:hypothetical protein